MRAKTFVAILPLLVAASSDARAHFKLAEPADRLQTDENGDPLGNNGTQKTTPCGEGMTSGALTMVRAGSMLHVKLTETIAHGGHYRIALVPKLNPSSADLPDPVTTVTNNNCVSAEIADPVAPPILADNLFPHVQAGAVSGKVWETDVLMPAQTGSATLQIIEFMTPHAPGCFYYHCAELEIVEADASVPDGGMIIMPNDAGTTAPPIEQSEVS
jgi:hypothetical protein